jgi:hypothetical protein
VIRLSEQNIRIGEPPAQGGGRNAEADFDG